jgi:hypothetical protein
MSFKKHISLFLVFFVSCSTSIRDYQGQQTVLRQATVKPVPVQPLLAQIKVSR